MSEQGQEDADPNVNFNEEEKLYDLIRNKEFDEAIEFLNDDRLTPQNKTAAVNYKDEYNGTTLMGAALYHAPLTLIQWLCEIGGKPLIVARTTLHQACVCDDPNIDIVKYLVQNGRMELINKKNNGGRTALDWAKRKENDSCYNFLQQDALQFPFHTLCSSVDVVEDLI